MSGIEPLALVSLGSTIAGTALKATGDVMRGKEEARAATFEQQQLKIQEETTKIAAAQEEIKRRNELTTSLEAIEAIRAGRGVGAASPTGMAIFDSIVANAERDIATSRFNYTQRADIARRSGEMAGERAKTSLLAGYLSAGADVLSGALTLGRIKKVGY